MPVKPNEVPLMNEERQRAFDEAVIKIDQEILTNAGRDPHNISLQYLGVTKGCYRGWFYEELARQYSAAGWKYVTVYESYEMGSHSGWKPYLHLSTKIKKTATESTKYPYRMSAQHLAGDTIV